MSFLDTITARLPFNKKSDTTEYFFAVSIGLSEVTSTVWGLYGKQIDILGQKTLPYTGTEDLIDKTHQVLDDSLGALDVEPEKVLFGVPDNWSMDDNLKEPYLKLLNKMLKDFDLSPMAYVTTTNSLSYLLQKQEGSPTTAILLGLGEYVEITLVKGGKIIGNRTNKRSNNLFEDIEKTLEQFTEVEVLPSKILLYGAKTGEDLSKLHAELMSYPWMAKLSFLHFPKIEILAPDILYQSVIFAGASELYPDLDLKHNFSLYQAVTPVFEEKIGHVQGFHSMSEKSEREDLGFVKGDIKKKIDNLEEAEESEEEFEKIEKTSFKKPRKLKDFSKDEEDLEDDSLISPDLPERDSSRYTKHLSRILSIFSMIKIPRPRFLTGLSLRKLIIPSVIFLILLTGYYFIFKASVILLVEPKILEKSAQVIADPKITQIDEANKIIPGAIIETTVTGSDKIAATGTKQIGDPAKGKVVLYNRTNAKVTVSQGTVLTSGSGLKFTLDTGVQIASQSSSLGADYKEVIEPGKTEAVGVTASAIGPESNLTGGTEMTVGNYTKAQVIAKVDQALSGGTSKSVTVVTSDDQKKLQAQLTNTLRQKAQEELKNQSKDGKKVIADALAVSDGKYSFNKQPGDVAADVTLNATIRFKGTSYFDTDLRTIVSKLVVTDVPANYEMNLQDAETTAEVAKVEKDGKLIFNAKFKAKMMPKFDTEQIKNSIRGKSISGASDKLKELEAVVGADIILTPMFPGPLARLPLFTQNISITVSPK